MKEAGENEEQDQEDQDDGSQEEQIDEDNTEGSEEEEEDTDEAQETADAEEAKSNLQPLRTLNAGKFGRAFAPDKGTVSATPTASSATSTTSKPQLGSASSSVKTPSTLGASSVASTLRSSRYAGVEHGDVPINDTPEELQPIFNLMKEQGGGGGYITI